MSVLSTRAQDTGFSQRLYKSNIRLSLVRPLQEHQMTFLLILIKEFKFVLFVDLINLDAKNS